MTGGQTALLAVIAFSVLVMAIVQVAVIVVAMRYAKQVADSVEALRRDLRPILDRAQRVTDDAARIAALATTQVERFDQMMTLAAARLDDTITVIQGAILQPVRQGAAAVTALRAAFGAFRGWHDRPRTHSEEDEALFVG